MAAFAFSRLRLAGRDTIFFVLLTSLMIPYAVTLIPTFILWTKLGAINTYLPLTVPAWFGGSAYYIFLLRQFLPGFQLNTMKLHILMERRTLASSVENSNSSFQTCYDYGGSIHVLRGVG